MSESLYVTSSDLFVGKIYSFLNILMQFSSFFFSLGVLVFNYHTNSLIFIFADCFLLYDINTKGYFSYFVSFFLRTRDSLLRLDFRLPFIIFLDNFFFLILDKKVLFI